jgi:fatty acid desaturase
MSRVPRNYALAGPERERAIADGLVSASWYQTPIDRKTLKQLMARRDGPALRDTAIWFALLLAAGYGSVHFWGSWLAVPFFMAYGVLYGTACDSRWHESLHGTPFKTNGLNDALYQLASFMQLWNPVVWRWSHMRHHSDTAIVGRDREIGTMRPPAMVMKALVTGGTTLWLSYMRVLISHARGHFTPDERDFVPADQLPAATRAARVHLAIHACVFAACLWSGSILPAMLISLPRLYGIWLLMLLALPQHAGLAEDVLDHRLNSRTMLLPLPLRFIYWNMNYHLEHHMFPMVPYHALPALHASIRHDCPEPKGLIATWRELFPALRRQLRDPDHGIEQQLPSGAGPARTGPRLLH